MVFDILSIPELWPILPELILIVGALLVPLVLILSKRKKVASIFTMIAAILVIGVTAYMMCKGSHYGVFMGIFEFNDFSGLLIGIFAVVLFIVSLVSYNSNEINNHGEYYSLLMIATAGMMFVASATDLIAIFIGIEMASISSYALVALKKNDPRSSEAAVKYLIVGAVSTALTLFGISLMYGLTGTTNLMDLPLALPATLGWSFYLAIVLMVAGIGFKVAAVPFHMWAPDVYEGAPTPVSAFLAVGSKKMGFVVLLKIFMIMFVLAKATTTPELQYLFAIIAALTMTVGNIMAISQTNIKRMLAYSSIAQAGYLLMVLAIASQYALAGGLFHVITHVFMKGGAFIIVAALCYAGIGEKIADYKGLLKRAPLVAVAMMIFLFSLAGIPPLAGFASKFFLFSSAFQDGTMMWAWLAVVAVINSAISLYYYAKVVKTMCIDAPDKEEKVKIPASFAIAIGICVVATIVMGIWFQPIIDLCTSAAAAFWPIMIG